MHDALPIIATVLGVIATAIGVASQLWPRQPPPPPAPTQPSARETQPSMGECAGCASLRADYGQRIREVEAAADKILLALAREEGAREERKQRLAEKLAGKGGGSGSRDSG